MGPPTVAELTAALQAHSIPVHPYLSLPGLSLSPAGIPYIPLTLPSSPHDQPEICLTPLCPDGWPQARRIVEAAQAAETTPPAHPADDVALTMRLMDAPSAQLGMHGTMRAAGAPAIPEDMVRRAMHEAGKERDAFLLSTVRPLASFLDWPRAPLELVAVSQLSQYNFRRSPEPGRTRWNDRERGTGGREFHWAWRVIVDEAWQRRGVARTVASYFITHYYAPYYHTYPGQLVSSYYRTNAASAALHRRLGFVGVALSDERPKDQLASLRKHEQWQASQRGEHGADGAARVGQPEVQQAVDDREERAAEAQSDGAEGPDLSLVCCIWTGPDGKEMLGKEDTVFSELPSL